MPDIVATISYESGNNSSDSLEVVAESYRVETKSPMNNREQQPMNVQQKEPDLLRMRFRMMTYTPGILRDNGEFIKEKKEDARIVIKKILALQDEIAEKHRPPICTVKWGDESFRGTLTQLTYNFTLYTDDAIPACVVCRAVFQEYIDTDKSLQNDNSRQSPDRSKYRTVCEGTQLYQLAYQEYDNPGSWRIIAEANGISDPLDLKVGAVLSLPPER